MSGLRTPGEAARNRHPRKSGPGRVHGHKVASWRKPKPVTPIGWKVDQHFEPASAKRRAAIKVIGSFRQFKKTRRESRTAKVAA